MRVQELIELLKATLIDVATLDFADQQIDINVSRLSVATGLQRKEINRLQAAPNRHRKVEPNVTQANLMSRIVGKWQGDAAFLSPSGRPRSLTTAGIESEFAELVRSVSTDINSYTVLFEMERLGLVEKDQGKVKLKKLVVDISGDSAAGYATLADDCRDLTVAVEENLKAPERVAHLHQRTEYDAIPARFLPKIRSWILKRGTEFQDEMRSYLAKYDADLNPELKKEALRGRVVVSSFSYTETLDDKGKESTPKRDGTR